MSRLTLLAAVTIFALPLATQAAQPISLHVRTAGDLADLCGADPRSAGADAKLNYCHGFAQGVVDVELRKAGDKKPFCMPTPTPSRSATLTEFTNWARALPAHRTLGAVEGLMQFLGERFPCK